MVPSHDFTSPEPALSHYLPAGIDPNCITVVVIGYGSEVDHRAICPKKSVDGVISNSAAVPDHVTDLVDPLPNPIAATEGSQVDHFSIPPDVWVPCLITCQ